MIRYLAQGQRLVEVLINKIDPFLIIASSRGELSTWVAGSRPVPAHRAANRSSRYAGTARGYQSAGARQVAKALQDLLVCPRSGCARVHQVRTGAGVQLIEQTGENWTVTQRTPCHFRTQRSCAASALM